MERCKEYIAAGDIFQVVLSQRLDFVPGVAPFDLYRALRQVNPSPYLYFLRMGETHVLGSSPEMLVRVTGRKLEYRPIAGTHPRGRDEAEDLRLEEQMRNDEKERAEHVMLVDLGRNDLGRVSEYGSVKVKELMYVERYSHVMHLVSALEGTLAQGPRCAGRFCRVFPGGNAQRCAQGSRHADHRRVGTDAARHLRRIGALCGFRGQSGFLHRHSHHAHAGKTAYLQAGAGIVADSDPAREFEESMNKAQALLRAVEMARGSAATADSLLTEILHHLLARIREHALGMELHALDPKLSMAQAHDGPGAIFFGGPGAYFQFAGKSFSSTIRE